ncbi:hypothetical protein [Bradyrhizobium sp. Leo121]|uniref:hypothetical protein n=1 Tax=Bradyrhizobium sp. Leo121 TaxID=1571195 RepID=UPI0010294B83|nr:hypothetical protein [Bradyrhizobium sp. Leo121]
MQDEPELEYAQLKEFFSFYIERYLKAVEDMAPDKRPMASLEATEKKSMKLAFKGLRQAINDCVEGSAHFAPAEVEKFDSELRSRGIVTLSELRRRYSKNYAKIIKRGDIKDETEYYLLRNVQNDPTQKTPEEIELLEN